jgi:hypothetical protein
LAGGREADGGRPLLAKLTGDGLEIRRQILTEGKYRPAHKHDRKPERAMPIHAAISALTGTLKYLQVVNQVAAF